MGFFDNSMYNDKSQEFALLSLHIQLKYEPMNINHKSPDSTVTLTKINYNNHRLKRAKKTI